MNTMNLFQWLALSLLLVMLCFELLQAVRGRARGSFWVVRVFTWIATCLAIYQPSLLTRLAKMVGIQRGTDLVLYVAVLVFLAVSLYLYARCLRLQKQITHIVRHLAIRGAREPNRE